MIANLKSLRFMTEWAELVGSVWNVAAGLDPLNAINCVEKMLIKTHKACLILTSTAQARLAPIS